MRYQVKNKNQVLYTRGNYQEATSIKSGMIAGGEIMANKLIEKMKDESLKKEVSKILNEFLKEIKLEEEEY